MTPRTAIITGGTTGIGLACARAFVGRGHRVAIGARRAGDAAVGAEVARQLGRDVMVAALDVASRQSVDDFAGAVGETLGAPTILVNAEAAENTARFHRFLQGKSAEVLPILLGVDGPASR